MRRILFCLVAVFACGCGSSEHVEVSDEPKAVEVETEAARRAREARTREVLPPGHVQFMVKNADLKDEVLPLIQKQAGVRILWTGAPRTVKRLRFTRPIHWKDAMALVCQFTNTHMTRDYQGRRVLRNGWSGRLESGDLSKRDAGSRGNDVSAAPRAGKRSGRSSGRRASATTWDNTYGGPSASQSNAGDTAKRVLKGTTTRRSGGR